MAKVVLLNSDDFGGSRVMEDKFCGQSVKPNVRLISQNLPQAHLNSSLAPVNSPNATRPPCRVYNVQKYHATKPAQVTAGQILSQNIHKHPQYLN